jgi:hypothetical protein
MVGILYMWDVVRAAALCMQLLHRCASAVGAEVLAFSLTSSGWQSSWVKCGGGVAATLSLVQALHDGRAV